MDYSTLITTIQQWLGIDQEDDAERLPNAVVGSIINMVKRDYLRRRESRFSQKTATTSTVVNQRDYDQPSDFSKPRQLWYIHPTTGEKVTLQYYDKDEFDKLYPGSVVYSTGGPYTIAGVDTSTVVGDPEAWTIWAGRFLLAPVPDSVITLFNDYFCILADYVASSNETDRFMTEAWEYLLWGSLVMSEQFGVEDDRIPMWQGNFQKAEMALDIEEARQTTTARVSQSTEPG